MNKKMRKLKKDVKRQLISIGYKKASRDLKNNFLSVFKTAIFDSSYFNEDENPSSFHPGWGGYKHPTITTVSECWGENTQLAPLSINKLSKQIAYYFTKSREESYIVECYHEKYGNSWVTF